MPNITTCTRCGKCYEETSEERANEAERLCAECFNVVDDRRSNSKLRRAYTILRTLAGQYASECGDCAGHRIVPDGDGGDEPCTNCADVWAEIDRAEAALR